MKKQILKFIQRYKKKNYYLPVEKIQRVEKYAKYLSKHSKTRVSGSIVIQQLIDELPE